MVGWLVRASAYRVARKLSIAHLPKPSLALEKQHNNNINTEWVREHKPASLHPMVLRPSSFMVFLACPAYLHYGRGTTLETFSLIKLTSSPPSTPECVHDEESFDISITHSTYSQPITARVIPSSRTTPSLRASHNATSQPSNRCAITAANILPSRQRSQPKCAILRQSPPCPGSPKQRSCSSVSLVPSQIGPAKGGIRLQQRQRFQRPALRMRLCFCASMLGSGEVSRWHPCPGAEQRTLGSSKLLE